MPHTSFQASRLSGGPLLSRSFFVFFFFPPFCFGDCASPSIGGNFSVPSLGWRGVCPADRTTVGNSGSGCNCRWARCCRCCAIFLWLVCSQTVVCVHTCCALFLCYVRVRVFVSADCCALSQLLCSLSCYVCDACVHVSCVVVPYFLVCVRKLRCALFLAM